MDVNQVLALDIARTSVREKILHDNEWLPDLNDAKFSSFIQNQGAFTTIYKLDGTLRGCIGVPYPNHSLGHAIAISARKTATQDPRFPRLTERELDKIYIEVEALSPITKIDFNSEAELFSQIDVGIHGLIVLYGNQSGLLLPKVGSRYNWDSMELVKHTCQKAGLPKIAYTFESIEFFKFTSVLYSEQFN